MQGRTVALFLPNLAGGGAERVALSIAKALVQQGHRVDLILIRGEGELLGLVPQEARVIELGGGRIASSLKPLIDYLKAERPDALHAFMWPVTIIALLARRFARVGTRIVVSDHTTLSRHANGWWHRMQMRVTQRLFYPAADARVHVSEAAADDMACLSWLPRSMVEVIANPVNAPARIATTPEVERLWATPPGQRILSVGSLKPTKDHPTLIRAFARLERPAARLMIVGEGAMRPKLEALAAELGVAERVIMPGFALEPWPFYASADLFVLSSTLEGQSLVLVEAMMSGLTVASTDCPHGPREVLDDGEFGQLVPVGDDEALADAMERSLRQPVDGERLRQRAMALSQSSSLDRHVDLLLG